MGHDVQTRAQAQAHTARVEENATSERSRATSDAKGTRPLAHSRKDTTQKTVPAAPPAAMTDIDDGWDASSANFRFTYAYMPKYAGRPTKRMHTVAK